MKHFLPLAAALLLLAGCAAEPAVDHIGWYEKNVELVALLPAAGFVEGEADDRTTLDGDAKLRSSHDLAELENHRLQLKRRTLPGGDYTPADLQIDFYFPAGVSRGQVPLARKYVMRKLVLGTVNMYTRSGAYDELLVEQLSLGGFARILSNIHIGDDLLLQEEYTDGKLSRYYENSALQLPQRAIELEWITQLGERAAELDKNITLTAQHALLGNTVLLQVHSAAAIDPDLATALKTHIEEEVAPVALRENNTDQVNDGLYPILVLEFYNSEGLYYYSVYVNFGSERGWRDTDWMNFDFKSLYAGG